MNIIESKTKIIESLKENKNFFLHKNLIIVGENGAGKSSLLKKLISSVSQKRKKGEKTNEIYFIDSTNRKIISGKKDIVKVLNDYKIEEIIETRLKKEIFNKEDRFIESDGNEILINEIIEKFDYYSILFEEMLDIKLERKVDNNEKKGIEEVLKEEEGLLFNNNEVNELSDGLQARIRILMEVDFAVKKGCKYVVIDEFNQNLDFQNGSILFKKLVDKYTEVRFIITTHSIHAIKDIKNCDVIKVIKKYEKVDNNLCEFYDGNDLNNLEIINKKLFDKKDEEDLEVTIFLSETLKKLLNGEEIENEKIKLEKMLDLTFKQNFIKKYILEKVNN